MRILNERDAKAIIYATALMGAGGGGSLAHGLFYLDAYAKNHEISVRRHLRGSIGGYGLSG